MTSIDKRRTGLDAACLAFRCLVCCPASGILQENHRYGSPGMYVPCFVHSLYYPPNFWIRKLITKMSVMIYRYKMVPKVLWVFVLNLNSILILHMTLPTFIAWITKYLKAMAKRIMCVITKVLSRISIMILLFKFCYNFLILVGCKELKMASILDFI